MARASATCSRLDFAAVGAAGVVGAAVVSGVVVLALVLDLVLALVLALVVVLGNGDEGPLLERGGKSNFGIEIPFWGAENFAPLGSGTLPVGISMP